MFRIRFIGLILFFPVLLSAQVNVYKAEGTENYADKNGFFYTLPYTWFEVNVYITKEEHLRGPYADFADKFLGLEDVITSDHNIYDIVKVDISSITRSDPTNYFFAEIDEKLVKEGKRIQIALDGSGILTGYSSMSEKPDKKAPWITFSDELVEDSRFKYFAGANRVQKTDTIIKRVLVDTNEYERIYFNKRWEVKSDEKKAEEAAAKIQSIRESRYNLLTGFQEIAYEEGTIKYMDQQLKKLEDEYLSLFSGLSFKSTLVYTFLVDPVPSEELETLLPVFTFSERSGVKELSNTSGSKVFLRIQRHGKQAGINTLLQSRQENVKGDRGFFYRVPESVLVSVEPVYGLPVTKSFEICQFGKVTYLPPTVTLVEFHPETGMVSKIIME